MGCLLGQTRNEPSLVSDGNRKAVVSAAIHWWFCWKMMYSVSKSFMVFRICQSLVNWYPCFLSGIHFVVMWVHLTRKNGFYFPGRVLEFGISLHLCGAVLVLTNAWLTCVLLLWKVVQYVPTHKNYLQFELVCFQSAVQTCTESVLGVRCVQTGTGADSSSLSRTQINCILCIKTSLHTYGQQNSLFLNNSLAVNAACWFWPRKSSRGPN